MLSKLVRHLDKRILKKSNGGAFRRKECVVSSPSVTEAPGTAPSWAVVQPSQPQDETLSSSMHMTSCNVEVDSDYNFLLCFAANRYLKCFTELFRALYIL